MRIRRLLGIAVVMFVSVFVLWGCPKKTEVVTSPETPQATAPLKEEPKVNQMKEGPKPVVKEESRELSSAAAGLQSIYFDFDSSSVRDDARAVLKANAEWLKANPKVKVRIEGNCDQRGTREYNQALGQRRATRAKKYLIDLGISANRVSLISYGKEKPICHESNEDCWKKNRRDDFVGGSE